MTSPSRWPVAGLAVFGAGGEYTFVDHARAVFSVNSSKPAAMTGTVQDLRLVLADYTRRNGVRYARIAV